MRIILEELGIVRLNREFNTQNGEALTGIALSDGIAFSQLPGRIPSL